MGIVPFLTSFNVNLFLIAAGFICTSYKIETPLLAPSGAAKSHLTLYFKTKA